MTAEGLLVDRLRNLPVGPPKAFIYMLSRFVVCLLEGVSLPANISLTGCANALGTTVPYHTSSNTKYYNCSHFGQLIDSHLMT